MDDRRSTRACLIALVALAAVSAAATVSAMSIEADPVKVTHRNAGPTYEIDEVEKTKLAAGAPSGQQQQLAPPAGQQPPPAEGAAGSSDEQPVPIGHVAIRRIFLFPMMRPTDWSQPDHEAGPQREPQEGEHEHEHEPPMPSMFAKPFWPFMTPARPSPAAASHGMEHERPHRPHLFGADEASRSPTANGADQDKAASSSSGQPEREPALFDPIQMMMDMMHQAINHQLAPAFNTDLNNSNNNKDKDNSPAETSDERPQMPGRELTRAPGALVPNAQNETREDIVEIEGKKYLRKTVTNKHVGENIVFMTRRLIFVPLNETDSAAGTTETVPTTAASPAAGSPSAAPTTAPVSGGQPEPSQAPASADTDRVGTNKPTPSASETTTTTTTTTAASTEQSGAAEMTTSQPATGSSVERAAEPAANGRASERLVEAGAADKPAEKPANSS
jgi:hypothetical protein